MTILQKLQNYKWTKETIQDLIHYFRSGAIPDWITNQRQFKRFGEKYADFVVERGRLIYQPLHLEVIPSDDPAKIRTILEEIYRSPEAIGKGQNNFYNYVLTKYLGIKRGVITTFLKEKPEYQLRQDKPKIVSKGILATKPFEYFAIDLVDMNYYFNVRANQRYRYIFSCIDIFTKFAWFIAIKKKDAPSTLQAFKKLLQYNLRFSRQPVYPKCVLSDGGAEFKGQLDTFFKEKGIRHITTRSYTPQANIENLNGQLRHMIRDNFIRTNSLAWYPFLQAFMNSKNTNKDQTTKETPLFLMQSYFSGDHPKIDEIAAKVKRKKEDRFQQFHKQEEFRVGDLVRVKMTIIQSVLRKKVKEGNKKLIVVRFSPTIYKIVRIIPVSRGKVGFPHYYLEDSAGQMVINSIGNPKTFNSGELLKIGQGTPQNHRIDLTRANFLNRVRAEDLNVEREPEQEPEPAAEPEPRPPRIVLSQLPPPPVAVPSRCLLMSCQHY